VAGERARARFGWKKRAQAYAYLQGEKKKRRRKNETATLCERRREERPWAKGEEGPCSSTKASSKAQRTPTHHPGARRRPFPAEKRSHLASGRRTWRTRTENPFSDFLLQIGTGEKRGAGKDAQHSSHGRNVRGLAYERKKKETTRYGG